MCTFNTLACEFESYVIYNQCCMLKSYLILALRNLWKRKVTSAINVSELAIGLASCALAFLYFQHELSFDRGFVNADNIYRITSFFNGGSGAPTVGLPYGIYLKSEVPEVEVVARMDPTIGTTVVHPKMLLRRLIPSYSLKLWQLSFSVAFTLSAKALKHLARLTQSPGF